MESGSSKLPPKFLAERETCLACPSLVCLSGIASATVETWVSGLLSQEGQEHVFKDLFESRN